MLGFKRRSNAVVTLILAAIMALYATAKFAGQDFAVYYAAASSLFAGRTDLYSADFALGPVMDYRYPPIFILIIAPIALLPAPASKFVFAFITVAVALFTGRYFLRVYEDPFPDIVRKNLIWIVSVLLSTKWLLMSFKGLNIHIVVLSLMVLGFLLAIRERSATGGSAIGFAAALKVFPLTVLPLLWLRRRGNSVAIALAILLLCFLLPAFYFGFKENVVLHTAWFDHVITPSEFTDLNGPPNQSLFGQMERLLTDVKYEDRVGDQEYPEINLLELDPDQVKNIGYVFAGLLVLSTFALIVYTRTSRRRVAEGSSIRDEPDRFVMHEFAFLITMMLLVGPRTNAIYFAALFVPIVVLLYELIERGNRSALIGLFFIALASVVIPLIPGRGMSRWAHVIGFDFLAALGAWFSLLIILLKTRFVPTSDEIASSSLSVTDPPNLLTPVVGDEQGTVR